MTDQERAAEWRRIALEVRAVNNRLAEHLGGLCGYLAGIADGSSPTAKGRLLLREEARAAEAAVRMASVFISAELAAEIGETCRPCTEAALHAEVARLRAALHPFAALAKTIRATPRGQLINDTHCFWLWGAATITFGDLCRAEEAEAACEAKEGDDHA